MDDARLDSTAPRRTRLFGCGEGRIWRSLDELAETEEFAAFIRREFPDQAEVWQDPLSRREFLALMAASFGVAGLTGCTRAPDSEIVPYVDPPEQVVPGQALRFATAMPLSGYGRGVLVESHLGRPTKIEGNPDHPASLGATDAILQASILTLYDPDRAKEVLRRGGTSTWGQFVGEVRQSVATFRQRGGRGLRFLTETVTSPTLTRQLRSLLEILPAARWHHYEPITQDSRREASRKAFGRPVNTIYHFDRAARILSLDADFLSVGPASLRAARQFIDARRVRAPLEPPAAGQSASALSMNRLYVIESSPSITGAMADHRLAVRSERVERLAREIAARLGVPIARSETAWTPAEERWIAALVADLRAHPGESVIVPGDFQSTAVHVIAHALNERLGSTALTHVESPEPLATGQLESLSELVREMRAGEVDTLVLLGGNPVLTAPADLDFAEALSRVNLRVHHSLYYDETSFLCHWHVPDTHYLETWSDVCAFDGTVSIIQPLIAPLYGGKSPHQILDLLLDRPETDAGEALREEWRARRGGGGSFDEFWRTALRQGVVAESTLPPVSVRVDPAALEGTAPPASPAGADIEVIFRPDPAIWDGRFANNGWLQELPRPLTKLTWDNAALVSPRTARALGVENERVVDLELRGRTVRAPVWVLPGHPDGSVTLHLGYGRERAGRVGNATEKRGGFNAYRLRTSDAMASGVGLIVRPRAERYRLACTQLHQMLEGPAEDLVHVETIQQFSARAARPLEPSAEARRSMYPEVDTSRGHQWALQIDINACVGCNACVVACQAENNIPVVGKEQVLNAREMHWLRIDTYHAGDPEEQPDTYFEPVPCMHCEKAPCEFVCPVGATTHSSEGLNEMTYNRCVGTRYCSNNCPYKVRRFNFLQYSDLDTPSLQLGRNPDVTVRSRGVMEKCTYCVQRIQRARIDLEELAAARGDAASPQQQLEIHRRMDDRLAALEPACAQACPTRAITFGDLNWKTASGAVSAVKALQMQPHSYALLAELNTQPRTRYLARLVHPNPDLVDPLSWKPGGGREEHPGER